MNRKLIRRCITLPARVGKPRLVGHFGMRLDDQRAVLNPGVAAADVIGYAAGTVSVPD